MRSWSSMCSWFGGFGVAYLGCNGHATFAATMATLTLVLGFLGMVAESALKSNREVVGRSVHPTPRGDEPRSVRCTDL